MTKHEKQLHYAQMLIGKISQVFEENPDFYIDEKELVDQENFYAFFHVLANLVPTHIFNKFANQKMDILQFNHFANILCFENGIKDDTK
jgi:hypothetical protein